MNDEGCEPFICTRCNFEIINDDGHWIGASYFLTCPQCGNKCGYHMLMPSDVPRIIREFTARYEVSIEWSNGICKAGELGVARKIFPNLAAFSISALVQRFQREPVSKVGIYRMAETYGFKEVAKRYGLTLKVDEVDDA